MIFLTRLLDDVREYIFVSGRFLSPASSFSLVVGVVAHFIYCWQENETDLQRSNRIKSTYAVIFFYLFAIRSVLGGENKAKI